MRNRDVGNGFGTDSLSNFGISKISLYPINSSLILERVNRFCWLTNFCRAGSSWCWVPSCFSRFLYLRISIFFARFTTRILMHEYKIKQLRQFQWNELFILLNLHHFTTVHSPYIFNFILCWQIITCLEKITSFCGGELLHASSLLSSWNHSESRDEPQEWGVRYLFQASGSHECLNIYGMSLLVAKFQHAIVSYNVLSKITVALKQPKMELNPVKTVKWMKTIRSSVYISISVSSGKSFPFQRK